MSDRRGSSDYRSGDSGGSCGDYHGLIKSGVMNTARSYLNSMTGRIGRKLSAIHAPKVLGAIFGKRGAPSAPKPKSNSIRQPRMKGIKAAGINKSVKPISSTSVPKVK